MKIKKQSGQYLLKVITGLSVLIAVCVAGISAAAAATFITLQGEVMTSTSGYGIRVKSDSLADGGKYLLVNSAVTVTGTIKNSVSSDQIILRLKTDSVSKGGASARISVDGIVLTTLDVSSLSWANYTLNSFLSAGTHTLNIAFLNPSSRNLLVDRSQFVSNGATPTVTPTSTSTSSPSPTGSETRNQAYITGYSYWDNTPAGSATISDPVLHKFAGGVGSYSDPITVAVGHSIVNGVDVLDFPKGTRFYVPNLRRYFIVEDTCGDGNVPQNGPCHTGYPSGASFWLDVWVGGGTVSASVSDACMNAITDIHLVIKNPANNYVVVPGEISANCAQYGDAVLTTSG